MIEICNTGTKNAEAPWTLYTANDLFLRTARKLCCELVEFFCGGLMRGKEFGKYTSPLCSQLVAVSPLQIQDQTVLTEQTKEMADFARLTLLVSFRVWARMQSFSDVAVAKAF